MSPKNLTRLAAALLAGLHFHSGTPARAQQEMEITSLSGTYLAGRAAGKNRDVAIAADLFDRALEIDPSNPVLTERAFLFDLSSGNIARAERRASDVIRFAPEHRLARTALGLKEFRAKRFAKAREHFRKSEFTPVGELAAGLFQAWSFAGENRAAQAFGALDQLETNEAFAGFKAYHGALIADLLGQKSKADDFYRQSYQLSGTSLRVVEAYASYLARMGNKLEARRLYTEFLAGNPNNPVILAALADLEAGKMPEPLIGNPNDGMAESLFSLASALTDDQSIDVALIYAELALAMKPDFVMARTLIGDINVDMGRQEQAITAFEAVPVTSPIKPAAEIQVALALNELDRKDEAIARLNALIAQDPKNFDALVTKGNLLRAHEEYGPAGEAYSAAIALVEKPERRHWVIFYSRAICEERQKRWPKAEADFRRALELEPEQPLVLNYLGYSFVEKGENLTEAMEMIRKAVELRPNDGYIVDSLGWAHYQLGAYEEAVKHLERAVELKPEDPVINDHLGDAYWRAGRQLEARFQWQHARDSDPDKELAAKIEGKLKNGLGPAPKLPVSGSAQPSGSAN